MATDRIDSSAYKMVGSREVMTVTGVRIEQQVIAIESALGSNPSLVFDLSKTLIESSCKTILNDRAHAVDENWDLPRLLKEASNKLKLSPDSGSPNTESLRKLLGGLQTTIQGICEMRNSEGFASHGKDGYVQQSENLHAHFVARAADLIVFFLFSVHRRFPASAATRRLIYEELTDFNEWLDEQQDELLVFTRRMKPSEVLFRMDPNEYRQQLTDYEQQLREPDSLDGQSDNSAANSSEESHE